MESILDLHYADKRSDGLSFRRSQQGTSLTPALAWVKDQSSPGSSSLWWCGGWPATRSKAVN